MAFDDVPPDWRAALAPALETPAARKFEAWLRAEEACGKQIYPPRDRRFAAFAATPLDSVRVVILGQDPYHGPGQAHGLAFSVPGGTKPPPSLANIGRELVSDLDCPPLATGDLTKWARQGVLLLNTALSVEQARAGSHAARRAGGGWEPITDAALRAVAQRPAPSVFMLWGAHAQTTWKRASVGIAAGHHLVLPAPHPSPLSAYRGFFGSRPFSRANAFLEANGRGRVDWSLT